MPADRRNNALTGPTSNDCSSSDMPAANAAGDNRSSSGGRLCGVAANRVERVAYPFARTAREAGPGSGSSPPARDFNSATTTRRRALAATAATTNAGRYRVAKSLTSPQPSKSNGNMTSGTPSANHASNRGTRWACSSPRNPPIPVPCPACAAAVARAHRAATAYGWEGVARSNSSRRDAPASAPPMDTMAVSAARLNRHRDSAAPSVSEYASPVGRLALLAAAAASNTPVFLDRLVDTGSSSHDCMSALTSARYNGGSGSPSHV